jgi:hypothetical protein
VLEEYNHHGLSWRSPSEAAIEELSSMVGCRVMASSRVVEEEYKSLLTGGTRQGSEKPSVKNDTG